MRKKRRLIWHLFPSYLLITVLAVVAFTWFTSKYLRHIVMEQKSSELHAIAQLLGQQFVPLLDPVQADAIDAYCEKIPLDTRIRITIVLLNGKVVGDSDEDPSRMGSHSNRPELADAFAGRTGESVRYSSTLQQRMMYVAVPLYVGERPAAAIRTSLSLSRIDRAVDAITYKIVLVGFFIVLFSALSSLFVSRKIALPIEKMTESAAAFARGDLDKKVPLSDYSEIATLGATLNEMAAQLDKRIKTIIQQRNEQDVMLSSMVEGVMALDREERVISINPAASRILGYPPDRLQKRTVQEILRNPNLIRFVKEALGVKQMIEGDILLHDGEERVLFARSTPLKDSRDKKIGILLVFSDVTQLRRLEKMRKDFAANVSHEIKTPLTAIKGFVETLQHGTVEDQKEQQRFLQIIEKHVNRLTAILEDLMHLSKIEKKDEQRELRYEKRKLKEVLLTTVGLCRDKAKKKGILVDVDCSDAIQAQMDPTLMEQAFFNLLDNAINYSDRDSRVRIVVAEQQEGEASIRFEDEGIGIPGNHIDRLFERFYRVDKARSRKLGGTGLGLAIVKHIVLAHKGRITVESAPGKGSTFTIHLPVD